VRAAPAGDATFAAVNTETPRYAASFERLRTILDALRVQCPWDKKQTVHTLRQLTLEETYELADAILEEDWAGMKEELGDILLHIVFYARIASEQKQFTLEDVIEGVCNKLVARHPHIYGSVRADTDEQVKQNWEALKLKEGKRSVMAGVPAALPSLVKALRIQEKAKSVGFEWDDAAPVRAKVSEELSELDEAVAAQAPAQIEEEFGDLLFSLVNWSRFLGIDPDAALERANAKFKRRFESMETAAAAQGTSLTGMSLEAMDELWEAAKDDERK